MMSRIIFRKNGIDCLCEL